MAEQFFFFFCDSWAYMNTLVKGGWTQQFVLELYTILNLLEIQQDTTYKMMEVTEIHTTCRTSICIHLKTWAVLLLLPYVHFAWCLISYKFCAHPAKHKPAEIIRDSFLDCIQVKCLLLNKKLFLFVIFVSWFFPQLLKYFFCHTQRYLKYKCSNSIF